MLLVSEPNPTPPGHIGAASGSFIRDEHQRVLIVKPVYKSTWEIPGGACHDGEPPRVTCRREVLEEIALDREPGRLLCVDFTGPPFALWQGLRFVFDGSTFERHEIEAIRLPTDELTDYRFVEFEEAVLLVAAPLARRLRSIAEHALANYKTVYLENGVLPVST